MAFLRVRVFAAADGYEVRVTRGSPRLFLAGGAMLWFGSLSVILGIASPTTRWGRPCGC